MAMKHFHCKVLISKDTHGHNFRVKTAKLNTDVEGDIKQVTFKNLSFRVGNDTQVVLYDDKYVFINTFDEFLGTLAKEEESKEIEPFLPKLIEENEVSSLSSAYPPGFITDYSILFHIDDLEWVSVNDALIINNVEDSDLMNKLINDGTERSRAKFESWDILPKPAISNPKIPHHASVRLNIGTGMILKELDTFLDLVVKDYSYLNIKELDCFYYMDTDRIQSLDKFLRQNRFLKKVVLKVASEEVLSELFAVLEHHPVLNIRIEYHGDVTESMRASSSKFIVKCIDRIIEIYCHSLEETISKKLNALSN